MNKFTRFKERRAVGLGHVAVAAAAVAAALAAAAPGNAAHYTAKFKQP